VWIEVEMRVEMEIGLRRIGGSRSRWELRLPWEIELESWVVKETGTVMDKWFEMEMKI
jgi:hypothetical protein